VSLDRGGLPWPAGQRHQIYGFLEIPPEQQNTDNAQRIRELMTPHHGWSDETAAQG